MTNIINNINNFHELCAFFSISNKDKFKDINDFYNLTKTLKENNLPKKRGWIRKVLSINQDNIDSICLEMMNDKIKKNLNKIYLSTTNDQIIKNHVFGYLTNKWIKGNAHSHLNSRIIFNLDIEKFFWNISNSLIIESLINFGFNEYSATFIWTISTNDNWFLIEWIAQSPIISNIVFYNIDYELSDLCKKLKYSLRYSRYVDDLTFSSWSFISPESRKKIKWDIDSIIKKYWFNLNHKKEKIYTKKRAQYVTGLTCNDTQKPRVSRKVKRNIRLEQYYMNKYWIESHLLYSKNIQFAYSIKWWERFIDNIEW